MNDTAEKAPTMRAQVDSISRAVAQLLEHTSQKPLTTTAEAPRPVPEANALRDCLRALNDLDAFERGNSRGASYSYTASARFPVVGSNAIGRVLRHLAERYGIQLVEQRFEPCARRHLDDIDPSAVAAALRDGASL